MKHRHHLVVYASLAILFLILVYLYPYYQHITPQQLRDFLLSFGVFAPLIFIILQTFHAMVPLIPGGQFLGIVSGYLFGIWLGTLYCIVGILIGSSITFLITKKYGERFIEKIVEKRELIHFELFFKKRGKYSILITHLIPLFPGDLISIGAGLTNIKLKDFVLMSFLGLVPHLLLVTWLGKELQRGLTTTAITLLSLVIIIFLIYLLRHIIKRLMIKEIDKIESKFPRSRKPTS